MPDKRPKRVLSSLQILMIEVVIYSVLVAVYLYAVLRTIAPVLFHLSSTSRGVYGVVCVVLMLGQGVLLEFLTTWLVARYARAHREDVLEAQERGGGTA
jgi:hypothetical protein